MRHIIRLFFIAVAASLFTAVRARAQTLQTALDATNLTWGTSGMNGAAQWVAENSFTHGDAAAAVGVAGEGGTSILQTTVTGPGVLTFWYFVPGNFGGELIFYSTSNLEANLSGGMSSWQQAVFYLGSGTQILTWTYTGVSYPTDPAYLDQVSWVTGTTAPVVMNQPLSQSQVPGMNATFSVGAGGTPPLSYQWYFDSNAIPGATSASYTVTNVQAADLGYYAVAITNLVGSNYSANASLEFGNVTGWGNNTFFQTSIPPGTTNVIGISAGAEQNLALKADGSLLAWGLNNAGQQPIPPNLSNVVAVAANSLNSMAITSGGSLIEWGDNTYGQITVTKALSNAVAAASSTSVNTIVLNSSGTVTEAGTIFFGATIVPPLLTNVVAVAVGPVNSMALESDGTITLWGEFNHVGLSNAVAIAMGGGNQCLALEPDGTVEEWSFGSGVTNVPPGLSNVVAIAAGGEPAYGEPGGEHFLALKSDGTVVAWGDNAFGETNVPAGLSNVVAIAAGQDYCVALVGNGPPVMSAPIQNPTLSSNNFSFSIPSQSGRVYQLEYKNNITDTNWTPLPLVAGNGTNLIMTDPTATNSQRFYRVQRW